MNIFSRIGMVSFVATAGSTIGLAAAPANTESISASIISVSSGRPYSLREGAGRYLAVHFLPAAASEADASADADFVKSYARAANTLAGVRELFVLEAETNQVKEWSSQLGPQILDLFVDSSGSLAAELHLSNSGPLSTPATIVFDQRGAEVFRQIGLNRHDHLDFSGFEKRFLKATEKPSVGEYNLPKGKRVAIDGYDPVAYFTESKAVKGNPALTSNYEGVQYQFASEANRAAFALDPEKYIPTYGGWCASAMGAKGTKVEIDPTNFKVSGGRLFLFYKDFFSDALKDWNRHAAEWEPAADANWKKLSGEDAKKPAK